VSTADALPLGIQTRNPHRCPVSSLGFCVENADILPMGPDLLDSFGEIVMLKSRWEGDMTLDDFALSSFVASRDSDEA
jgi:hypothetical protein